MGVKSELLKADDYILQQHERVVDLWQEKFGRPKKTLENICQIATIVSLVYTTTVFAAQEEELFAVATGAMTVIESLRFAPPSFLKDAIRNDEELNANPYDFIKQSDVLLYGAGALLAGMGGDFVLDGVLNHNYSRAMMGSGVGSAALALLFQSAKGYFRRIDESRYIA